METFVNYLKNIGNYNNKDIVAIKYGLAVIKNELSKFFLFLMFYLLVGRTMNFLFYFVILSPVRMFTGGIHMKSNFACTVISFLLSIIPIILLPCIQLHDYMYYLLQLFTIMTTIVLSPIKNPNRPITTKLRYKNLKKKASTLIIIANLVLLVLSFNNLKIYYVIGVWTLFLNALQLLIIKFFNNRKGGDNENFKNVI